MLVAYPVTILPFPTLIPGSQCPAEWPHFCSLAVPKQSQWERSSSRWLGLWENSWKRQTTGRCFFCFLPYFPSFFLHRHDGWSCSSRLGPWGDLEGGIHVPRMMEQEGRRHHTNCLPLNFFKWKDKHLLSLSFCTSNQMNFLPDLEFNLFSVSSTL